MISLTITEEVRADLRRARLGRAWWGRSSVRVSFAALVVVGAVVAKATLGPDRALLAVALAMGVPALLVTLVRLRQRRAWQQQLDRDWPLGATVTAAYDDQGVTLSGPAGERRVRAVTVMGISRDDRVVRLHTAVDGDLWLPAGLVPPEQGNRLAEAAASRRPGFPM